jgi:hypothetical protein
MNGHDGVERIGFARKHCPEFELVDVVAKTVDLPLEIGLNSFAFAGQLEVSVDVARAALKLRVVGELRFYSFPIAHDRLRKRRVRPQRWVGKLLFDGG